MLEKLPGSLGACTRLEVINVEHNRIALLSKRIGELPKLRFLLVRPPAAPAR